MLLKDYIPNLSKINRKIFIHINTTNPILLPDSQERREAEDNGWEISFDGMEIQL